MGRHEQYVEVFPMGNLAAGLEIELNRLATSEIIKTEAN